LIKFTAWFRGDKLIEYRYVPRLSHLKVRKAEHSRWFLESLQQI